jgi:hypothetical protein
MLAVLHATGTHHLTSPRAQVDHNALSELPNEIGQCSSLTAIDASDNQMRALPSAIGRLTNVTRLHLQDNPIQSLPPDLKRLTNIVDLKVCFLDVSCMNQPYLKIQQQL